jgi:hypothetical protein
MMGLILFIGVVVVGVYLLNQKLENEKKEDFEDRNN